MSRHPTPIADELRRLASSLVKQVATDGPLSAAEVQNVADHLDALAGRAAPVERFRAELVAEAAEEELRQASATDYAGQIGCEAAHRR